MSKQKHTPGPWKVSRGEPAVIAQDDEVVATCYLFRGADEDYANARLIAAAPQLLEACKEFISAERAEHEERHERAQRLRSQATKKGQQAIAKAEGDK